MRSVALDRRNFLRSLAIIAASPALPQSGRANESPLGPLRRDPNGILDLPAGFSYQVVSRAGDRMSDGLLVPHAHDGMGAFAGADGRVILVCNHELDPSNLNQSAFGPSPRHLPRDVFSKLYDAGKGLTPGAGGTTTTVYDPHSCVTERQHLSLAGTEFNCAGGSTPWGTWLSCEECVEAPGKRWNTIREKPHGYVFEVPANAAGLVEPRPITAMGRFEHEAAAVHEASGIVYMTEDKRQSLFYRYIPDSPGKLHDGGRLQALAVADRPSLATNNWSDKITMRIGEPLPTFWIDIDDVDSDNDDLRNRGASLGAAKFARGEGLCAAGDEFFFACTIGGPARLGQVFAYQTSPSEGTEKEQEQPGELTLVAEAATHSLLRNADNVIMAPWGDLLVCEDTASHCGIVGVRPNGSMYEVADNAYSNSELAGTCFSPDGTIMFVNIQYPGMTLAITGPWPP
ncbi:MAG: DUF839 domain-containing protein [Proteobacteria bacterium]|nr:DUF839 domain-containing protein [Pseudomonadota bacterium]